MNEEQMRGLRGMMDKMVRVGWLDVERHAECECEPYEMRPPLCGTYGVLRYADYYRIVVETEMRGEDEVDMQVFPAGCLLSVVVLRPSDDEVRF